jgi:hypothetical protein
MKMGVTSDSTTRPTRTLRTVPRNQDQSVVLPLAALATSAVLRVMTALATEVYSYTMPYGTKYCAMHGYYYTSYCPGCNTAPPYQPNVTISPGLTEAAIVAMVKAYDLIISDLREQVADRDRRLQELQTKYDKLEQAAIDFTDNA